jgi:sterol desaturase/sphingolipid hydroxylase (fatty acid hydroxylase superfamily)
MQRYGFGILNHLGLDSLSGAVVSLFILDLTAYLWHVANHRIAGLWRFHSVHHSDEIFDASTAVRFHIGELLISLIVRLAVVAVFGLPVLGILVFEIVYAFFNFFEHGNIRLPDGFNHTFSRVFVTPVLHRYHHSANNNHLNTNFGTIFSIWDRVFRTFSVGTQGLTYKVGLPDPAPWTSTFGGALKHPFLKVR